MTYSILATIVFVASAFSPPVRMKVTAYAPDSGDGISGSGTMASNVVPFAGAAACPARLPFGTKVILNGRARLRAQALRLPFELVCMDRFAVATREGIDIAIPEGFGDLDDAQRIELAKVFGLIHDYPSVIEPGGIITYSEAKK